MKPGRIHAAACLPPFRLLTPPLRYLTEPSTLLQIDVSQGTTDHSIRSPTHIRAYVISSDRPLLAPCSHLSMPLAATMDIQIICVVFLCIKLRVESCGLINTGIIPDVQAMSLAEFQKVLNNTEEEGWHVLAHDLNLLKTT